VLASFKSQVAEASLNQLTSTIAKMTWLKGTGLPQELMECYEN
jgi:hypothetical protein